MGRVNFVKRVSRGPTRITGEQVLDHVRANPGRTTREIAMDFDSYPTLMSWHLRQLRGKSLVELRNPGDKQNPGRWYAIESGGPKGARR